MLYAFLIISSTDTFMKITIQYFFIIITWQRRIVGSQYGPNHLVLFNKSSPHLYVICLMSRWTMILRSISDAMKNYNVKQNQISWPTLIWFNSWNWRSSTEKLKAATVASEGFYGSSTRMNSVTIISIGFRCCIYSYIPILLLCSCWCLCHLFPKKTFWYGGFGLTIVPAKCDVHLGEKTGYLIIYRWVNTQVWGSLI